jgi:dipeptidyl aminopeptidase/acylaminoacyl peptidase
LLIRGGASLVIPGAQSKSSWQPADLHALGAVSEVQLSPTGTDVAYSVTSSAGPGRPTSSTWLRDLESGDTVELVGGSGPRWSPDGRWIAYFGTTAAGSGLIVADRRGKSPRPIAPVSGTNHPLPSSGERVAWSPDGKFLAYISATDGPESAEAQGDPMVITRYLFKPTATEGLTRFNDNRRLHIFVADVEGRGSRQLTDGPYYEHSIDWSPTGDRIVFVSNRGPNPDMVFNYDLFAVSVAGGAVTRLTDTKSAEYYPVWSPDGSRIAFSGTSRDLTSSETTMEDTHVWTMRADGSARAEMGQAIDNRQGPPQWSADGRTLVFTVQERGTVTLVELPADAAAGAEPRLLVGARGSVSAFSVTRSRVAYAFAGSTGPAELFLLTLGDRGAAPSRPEPLTALNRTLLDQRALAEVEAFTFRAADGLEIEAFLTKPPAAASARPASVPLIVMIHGGPHGQQGPAFNAKAQVYAGRGWASLMVNYRGSTGYGQKLTDAIFRDQNGREAEDVVAGVDAALARYPFLDPARLGIEGGSYGGQLTNWIITQTTRFKAAVPTAGISNLVTQNYLAYYHDYLAVEYGGFPHQIYGSRRERTAAGESRAGSEIRRESGDGRRNGAATGGDRDGSETRRESGGGRLIIDELWERSPIRLANRVTTPVLFIHGENDNDVPIEEAEQFYIALHDVGVETVMVRYPREGHGLRETRHIVDALDRSIAWYERFFR